MEGDGSDGRVAAFREEQVQRVFSDMVQYAIKHGQTTNMVAATNRLGAPPVVVRAALARLGVQTTFEEINGREYEFLPMVFAPGERVERSYTPRRPPMSLSLRQKGRSGAPLKRIARRLSKNVCGVYVIRCETTGRYKIGKSVNVGSRLRQHASSLQSDAMPGPLRLSHVIYCSPRRLGHLELLLHWLYDAARLGEEEVFEAGLSPAPESLRTVVDVFAACRSLEE